MHSPLGIRTEILLGNGTWQNISTSVRRDGGAGIRIRRQRQDERARTSPTSVDLTIEDPNGDWNDLNPLSPYYGLFGPNSQLRVSLGKSVSKEDDFNRSVSNQWTGGAFTWTITTSAGAANADFDIDGTHGTQTNPSVNVLHYSTADAGEKNMRVRAEGLKLSAATVTGASATWWVLGRFTDINNYYAAHVQATTSGGMRLSLYKRVSGALTQIDQADADFDTSSNFSTDEYTVELYVEGPWVRARAWNQGDQDEPQGWDIEVRDTSLSLGNGFGLASRRETGNTNANLVFLFDKVLCVPGTIRAHVQVPEFGAARWQANGADVTMALKGAGIGRRLAQEKSLRSPMYEEITRSSIVPVGYWPMEETKKSSSIASGLSGGVPLSIIGTDIEFGQTSEFPGTGSLVRMGTGVSLRANVLSSADTGQIKAAMILSVPDTGLPNGTPLIEVSQAKDATVRKWRLIYLTGGDLQLAGFSQGGSVVEDSGAWTFEVGGNTQWIWFTVAQNGADVDWSIQTATFISDGSASTGGVTGTFTTSSVGAITGAVIGPTGLMNDSLVGQFVVGNDTSIGEVQDTSLIAHLGETTTQRFGRLCRESNIAYRVVPSEDSISSIQMGPQRVSATLLQNLQDCEDAENGILYEPRDFLGLAFRTHENLYNQHLLSNIAVFNYASKHISNGPFSVPDELLRGNDVTATRPGGEFYRSIEETGPRSVSAIGQYDKPVASPVRNAVDLPDIARWNRHTGTWGGARYPSVSFETTRSVFANDPVTDALIDELEMGNYLAIEDLPAWLPPETIETLSLGNEEKIENVTREITFNTIPYGPYKVAVRGTSWYRDSAASTLAANAAAGATSLSVSVTGPLWRTGAVSFNVMIEGSLLAVTNISGATSPQTFTVSAARVNGVDKALTSGSEVHIHPLSIRALTSVNFNTNITVDVDGDTVVGRDTPPSVWVEGEATASFTSSTFIEDAIPIGVTFTVPSTGAVWVYIAGELENDNAGGFTIMSFNVRSTSEIGGGTLRLAASDANSILLLGTDNGRFSKAIRLDNNVVTSFLAGREYNITFAHRRATAGNAVIRRRLLLVTPDKVQGGLPGSLIDGEPASRSNTQNASDTTTSVTYTTADMTACGTSFVAPQSGRVKVCLSARIDNAGANSCYVSYRIGTGSTVGAGTEIEAAADSRALENFQVNNVLVGQSHIVTGLTPEVTYNVVLLHRVNGGTGTLENRMVAIMPEA